MTDNVKEARLGCFGERRGDNLAKSRVLLFCLKHPRMNFTVECIGVDQEINKAALEEEIQSLVDQGVVNKRLSGSGTTLYCSNRTQQELVKLVEVLPLYKNSMKS